MNKTCCFCSFLLLLIFSFTSIQAQPNLFWAGEIDGSFLDEVHATDFDPDGNLLIAGSYCGAVDLDLSPEGTDIAQKSDGADGYIAKYSSDGALIWKQTINLEWAEMIKALRSDAEGNVWIAGEFSAAGDIDPDPRRQLYLKHYGDDDMFVAKLSPHGDFLWAQSIGTGKFDRLWDLTVDRQGNCIISGAYYRERGANTYLGPSIHGNPDIFFAKFSPGGQMLLKKHFRAAGMGRALGVDVDPSGNIYLVGNYNGKADMGKDIHGKHIYLTSRGDTDLFVAKFDERGHLYWAKSVGGALNDEADAVAVDDAGNVFVGGTFHSNNMDFDPDPGKTARRKLNGRYDAYLAKFTTNGELLWVNGIGGEAWDAIKTIDLDPSGNPVVGGFFTTWCQFDPARQEPRVNAPSRNHQAFVAKYHSGNGKLAWAMQIGGTEDAHVLDLAVDPQGRIMVGGEFKGKVPVEYAPGQYVNLDAGESSHNGFLLYLGDDNLAVDR